MLAAANGSKELVELLLKKSAYPLLKDTRNFTTSVWPFLVASMTGVQSS